MNQNEIAWIDGWFKLVKTKLDQILQGEVTMTQELDALKSQVDQTVSVEAQAIAALQKALTTIGTLTTAAQNAGVDTTEVVALTQELNASMASMQAQIAAMSPVPAPTTPPASS